MKASSILIVAALGMIGTAAAQEARSPIPAWNRAVAAVESTGTPAQRGAAVFNNRCSICHGRDVRNAPGTSSLQYKYQGALPPALEDRTDLTPQLIETVVRTGIAVMPQYRKTELSDAELAALSAYLTHR